MNTNTPVASVTVFAYETTYLEIEWCMYDMQLNTDFTIEQTDHNTWKVSCEGITEPELVGELEHSLLNEYNVHIEAFYIV